MYMLRVGARILLRLTVLRYIFCDIVFSVMLRVCANNPSYCKITVVCFALVCTFVMRGNKQLVTRKLSNFS